MLSVVYCVGPDTTFCRTGSTATQSEQSKLIRFVYQLFQEAHETCRKVNVTFLEMTFLEIVASMHWFTIPSGSLTNNSSNVELMPFSLRGSQIQTRVAGINIVKKWFHVTINVEYIWTASGCP